MADPFLKRYPLGFAFYFLIPANAQRENFLLVHFYYNTLLLLGGFTTYSTPWLRVPVYETNITNPKPNTTNNSLRHTPSSRAQRV